MSYVPRESECLLCVQVTLVSRDQPCRGNVISDVVSNPEIQVLSPRARCCFRAVPTQWVRLGRGGGSWHLPVLLCCLSNGGWQTSAAACPLSPHQTLGLVAECTRHLGQNVSVIPVLRFANSVSATQHSPPHPL